MKTIQITISKAGQTTVQTHGFTGSDCRAASQFLERALGQKESEQLTSDFYETQTIANSETQKEG